MTLIYSDRPAPEGPFLAPTALVEDYYPAIPKELCAAFNQVRSCLISSENVLTHLRKLDASVDNYAPPVANTREDENGVPVVCDWLDEALGDFELEAGFDTRLAVIPAPHTQAEDLRSNKLGDAFREILLSGRPIIDFGTDRNHGELSHRLQWYIAGSSLLWLRQRETSGLYRELGKTAYKRTYYRNNLDRPYTKTLWTDLFDLGPTKMLDARSPAWLNLSLIYGELSVLCPNLSASISQRYFHRRPRASES